MGDEDLRGKQRPCEAFNCTGFARHRVGDLELCDYHARQYRLDDRPVDNSTANTGT